MSGGRIDRSSTKANARLPPYPVVLPTPKGGHMTAFEKNGIAIILAIVILMFVYVLIYG